ncbi:nucleoporin Nup107 [Schizosaccharomyces octosporus yFS286]|uniref:Nuclear pore complex protein n=1 Tax=Schizosaccharomyces octosporus (strain yFS286) TaxID=483514 RepID=S9RHD4_SCHOY|nr:nucleoporin Nup107 [Schizosaccharomyces octosporus yFS286]EPX73454.1 nucleoporin Nup107 [Schizosaccharomyces octosporus yFS286]
MSQHVSNDVSKFTISRGNEDLSFNEDVMLLGPNGMNDLVIFSRLIPEETPVTFELGDEFESFANTFLANKDDLFSSEGLLTSFYKLCEEKYSKASKEEDEELMNHWGLELRTWDLIQRIYSFRNSAQDQSISSHMFSSIAVLEEEFYSKYPAAFENHLVFNWLRDSPVQEPDIEIRGNRWFYTRENIKKNSRTHSKFSLEKKDESNVSNLDPDADIRDERRLDERDDNYDRQFIRVAFSLYRAGDFEGLLDLCRKSGNYWRSASLQGAFEYRNSVIDEGLHSETLGNKRKELWRRTCFALTKNKRTDAYERALYGALCGDLESVLNVCTSWEDALWAYYNSMNQYHLDVYLSDKIPQPDTHLPPIDSGIGLSPEVIFEALDQFPLEEVRTSAAHPLRRLQAYIILNQVDKLFTLAHQQLEAVRAGSTEGILELTSPSSLRIMVHLLLFMRIAGIHVDAYISDSIIQSYIELLASSKKNSLVPLYIPFLSDHIQYEAYARFLNLIEDGNPRLEQLRLAKKFELDIDRAALMSVSLAFEKFADDAEHSIEINLKSLDEPVPLVHTRFISTLEWLIITCQSDDLLVYANCAFRYFLSRGELNSAYLLYTRLPAETLDVLTTSEIAADNSSKVQTAYEFMNYRALCRAFHVHEEWNKLMNEPILNDTSSTKASVAYKEWKKSLTLTSRRCIKLFTELLRANFLHPSTMELNEDEEKELCNKLYRIRNIYVPEIILNLHGVYFHNEDYNGCFALANEVAGEDLKLYHCLLESGRIEEYAASLGVVGEHSLTSSEGIFSI